jgi:hypothetical protein
MIAIMEKAGLKFETYGRLSMLWYTNLPHYLDNARARAPWEGVMMSYGFSYQNKARCTYITRRDRS